MQDLDKLVESLAAEAKPVTPAPHPFKLSLQWGAAAAIYLFLSLWISGLRPDLLHKLHEPWFMAELLALLLVFITASLSAAVLAFPDLHQMNKSAWSPAWAFALFFLVMLLDWHADNPPAPLPKHSFECTVSITLFSLLPAIWTFLSLRRFATTHAHWAGSVALLAAFSTGAIWLRLHELNDSISHVLLWHYLPMLIIGLLGWWLGRRLLKW